MVSLFLVALLVTTKPKERLLATIATTITAVYKPRELTARRGPNAGETFYSYEFKAGGQKFQTTKGELGQKAEQLKGQPVQITYTESQNGEFTNRTVSAIEPVAAETGNVTQVSVTQDDRQERIERQSARRDAIAFASLGLVEIQGVNDIYSLADEFARYGREGQTAASAEEEPQY